MSLSLKLFEELPKGVSTKEKYRGNGIPKVPRETAVSFCNVTGFNVEPLC